MIKEAEYKFINGYGRENIYLRKADYDKVCAIITDFFEEELVMNDFHEYFVNFLNTLEDQDDVDFIRAESSFYWAICIVQNKRTTDHLIKGKSLDDYVTWLREYYKKTGIGSYILETVDKDVHTFSNENDESVIFLTKKYYDFVSQLVKDFFTNGISNNMQHSLFLGLLNTIHLESSFKEILDSKPYEWALRIIHDQEDVPELDVSELEQYHEFRDAFFKENNMNSFVQIVE